MRISRGGKHYFRVSFDDFMSSSSVRFLLVSLVIQFIVSVEFVRVKYSEAIPKASR